MTPAWDVPTEIADVTVVNLNPIPISGTVTANQGTSPWVVTGTVTPPSVSTSTVTRVASGISSHLLVAANINRKGLMFYNDGSAQQFIKFGATASTTDFSIRMTAQSYLEVPLPIYTGQIDVISSTTNGAIQVTELT
jgi:hypothetical protein